MLREGDYEASEAAAEVLPAIGGERIVLQLREILRDPKSKNRAVWHTLEALGGLWAKGAAATPDVIPFAASRNELHCAHAVDALCNFGPGAAAALPVLMETYRRHRRGKSRDIAESALEALGRVAPGDPRVHAILAEALSSRNEDLFEAATTAIFNLRPVNEETVRFLIKMIAHQSDDFERAEGVSNAAVMALNGLMTPDKRMVKALQAQTYDPRSEVRRNVQKVLGNWKRRSPASFS
jgi:HEAT repeat protein